MSQKQQFKTVPGAWRSATKTVGFLMLEHGITSVTIALNGTDMTVRTKPRIDIKRKKL